MQEFFGQFDLLKEEIERYRKSNYTVIVQATSHHNLQQLHKNLEEYGIRLDYIDGDTIIPQASQLVVGGLAHGFQFVDEKNCLYYRIRDLSEKDQTKDSQAKYFQCRTPKKL